MMMPILSPAMFDIQWNEVGSVRILLLPADIGEGHVAAARALEEGLLEHDGASVVHEDGLRRRRLARRMRAMHPDVVVSTHPALTAALGRMRRRGQLRAVLCATITDLTDNPMWCDPGADVHVVMDPIAVPWVERHAAAGSAVAVRPLISPPSGRAWAWLWQASSPGGRAPRSAAEPATRSAPPSRPPKRLDVDTKIEPSGAFTAGRILP